MNTQQKGQTIKLIIASLQLTAKDHNKNLDEGDTFFSLCFKSDKELKHIAKLCGV